MPVRLQKPRDFNILYGLYHSRVMWREHIAALYFTDKDVKNPLENAKKRLQDLQDENYVGQLRGKSRRPYEVAIYRIARKGFEAIQNEGMIDSNLRWESVARRAEVKPSTLEHELTVMAVKSCLEPAINACPEFQVEEFSTWPVLYKFMGSFYDFKLRIERKIPQKPDGFIEIVINENPPRAHRFFLEVDLTSEVHTILAQKAQCYSSYYRSGDFAVWLKKDRANFKDFPFRTMMVVESAERRNNAADFMLRYTKIKELVLLTTLNEIKQDPLGAIWVSPADYNRSTEGTTFDVKPEEWRPNRVYMRNSARDRFVEQSIKKHRLFE